MQPYQIFSGAAEVIAATLLLFRRTTTLGALVSVGVLLNVVMLNLCYDVSVKLFSINLLLAAVFLAAPDITKLARFFVLNRPMEPAEALGPTFQRRWLATTAVAFKFLFFTAYLYQSISGAYRGYQFQRVHPPRPALYADADHLVMQGMLASDSPTVRMKRIDPS